MCLVAPLSTASSTPRGGLERGAWESDRGACVRFRLWVYRHKTTAPGPDKGSSLERATYLNSRCLDLSDRGFDLYIHAIDEPRCQ